MVRSASRAEVQLAYFCSRGWSGSGAGMGLNHVVQEGFEMFSTATTRTVEAIFY